MTIEERLDKIEKAIEPLLWDKSMKDRRLQDSIAEKELRIDMLQNPKKYGVRTIKWL